VLFCHLIRSLASDRKYAGTFAFTGAGSEGGAGDLASAPRRLIDHLARPPKKTLTKAHKKPAKAIGKNAKSPRGHKAPASVRKRVSKPKGGAGKKRAGAR
jgi:hypothetical protein